ncbi:pupal cuticle protein Edg-84A-like [Glossina fuscipes fuscipes]
MVCKFVLTLTLIAAANAAVVVPAAPVLARNVELEEYDPHPQYRYGYDVQDTLSGDAKGHVEERDGDLVRGEYSLIDADGFKRTVSYTADDINGFNAVVRREPLAVAAPVVAAAPLVAAAPVVKAAPLVAAAPAVRSAPLIAAAPAVRAAPLVAATPAVRAAPLYAPAPFVKTSAPLIAPAPIVKSAPLLAAPVNYFAPTFAVRHF